MRGKVCNLLDSTFNAGITPAYAGKSCRSQSSSGRGWDHPRICGEKTSRPREERAGVGSPPHMRGKAQIHLGLLVVLGITPAYAGKSTPSHTVKQDKKDHPRICGEKTDRLKLVRNAPGSPPHMRGKVLIRFTGRVGVGITPAYAGKSRQKPTAQPVRRDHPRICGEKYPSGGRPHCGGGSPPHMRGKEHEE